MSKAFDFCIPTRGTKVPHTPDWIHEIKYDGYRLRVERDSDRVRLITRNGYDWTKRYPWIVEAALKNRMKHFVIDGEAVIFGVDGRSDFAALHSALNPKSIAFFVAFLPLFLSPNGDFLAQMIIFETTFLMLAFANAFGYALVAFTGACIRAELKSNQRVRVNRDRLTMSTSFPLYPHSSAGNPRGLPCSSSLMLGSRCPCHPSR
jgi:hypothetical protein